MIPAVDNNVVAEGTGLLTSRYINAAATKGIITALLLRVQELETQFYSLITGINLANHPMPGGPWSILDQLGALVGAPRTGLPDAQYVQWIKLKARVNRSRGLSEDLLKLAVVLNQPLPAVYVETYPAAFYIGAWNSTGLFGSFALATSVLQQARGAGVYGVLAYTTWAAGNDFSFSSVYDSTQGEAGYGSVYSPSAGGLMVAGIGI